MRQEIKLIPLDRNETGRAGCIGFDNPSGPIAGFAEIDPNGLFASPDEADALATEMCRRWNDVSGWQPIETAPQDKRVLVIGPGGLIHSAIWSINPITEEVAWMVARISDEGDCLIMHPTHWMPLPAPPIVAYDPC